MLRSAMAARRPPISTHALHEEGDGLQMRLAGRDLGFLPTPSTRRATGSLSPKFKEREISTHALHEEGDTSKKYLPVSRSYFYPRPPRGGRLVCCSPRSSSELFLPTPSTRRATVDVVRARFVSREFLPTPSTRRATAVSVTPRWWTVYFYPRPPRGGRRLPAGPVQRV